MMKLKTSIPMFKDRVLAVDPGFGRVGLAVMEADETRRAKLLFSTCLETDSRKQHGKRLLAIGGVLGEIIERWQPGALAIETLFFNTNVTSALGVAEARGVVIYESAKAELDIFEYSPQAVKVAVTGYGRADKRQMLDMLKKLMVLPGKSGHGLDDELDAIALGITHLATKGGI